MDSLNIVFLIQAVTNTGNANNPTTNKTEIMNIIFGKYRLNPITILASAHSNNLKWYKRKENNIMNNGAVVIIIP